MNLTRKEILHDIKKDDSEKPKVRFDEPVNQQKEYQVQSNTELRAKQKLYQHVKRKAKQQFGREVRRQTKRQRLSRDMEKFDGEELQKRSQCTSVALSSVLTWVKNTILLVAGLVFFIITLRIALYRQKDPDSERLRVSPSNFSTILNCGQNDPCWRMLAPMQSIRRKIDERYRIETVVEHNDKTTISVALDTNNGTIVMLTSFLSPGDREPQPLPQSLKEIFDYKVEHWPIEIPAVLAMTWAVRQERPNNRTKSVDNWIGFIPILDYFVVCLDSECSKLRWCRVTPPIKKCTLREYGMHLKGNNSMTIQELDMKFRPSFNRFLTTLSWLHERGMCHDYINPDSIHVHEHENGWYLANYEQIREITHPYHFSQLWVDLEMWADCRLNDVRHATKAYLSFLRTASGTTDSFDRALFDGTEPWSRLYWRFLRNPVSASSLLRISASESPRQSFLPVSGYSGRAPGWVPWRVFMNTHWVRAKAAELELEIPKDVAAIRRHRLVFAGWWVEQVNIVGEITQGDRNSTSPHS